MPTRNRAHLLAHSLQSALEQSFDDYEIIVCDNASADETASLVRQISDSRVRYVRADRMLSMPDNWEFALSFARGAYVTYLCDDDAVSPRLLQSVADAIAGQKSNVVTWACGGYYHDNWYESDLRNTVQLPAVSCRLQEMDAPRILRKWFDELWPAEPSPKMLQSCCSRELIERLKGRAGRFFVSPCPDVAAAVMTLSAVESYTHIDNVLMLSGSARESNGAAQWYNKRAVVKTFADEFQGKLFNHVPMQTLVTINFVAETLLEVKRLLSDKLNHLELNWNLYFTHCYRALLATGENGTDVSEELAEFHRTLDEQSESLAKEVRQQLSFEKSPQSQGVVRRIVKSNPLLEKAVRAVIGNRRRQNHTIRGETVNCFNILDCARRMDELVSAQ